MCFCDLIWVEIDVSENWGGQHQIPRIEYVTEAEVVSYRMGDDQGITGEFVIDHDSVCANPADCGSSSGYTISNVEVDRWRIKETGRNRVQHSIA